MNMLVRSALFLATAAVGVSAAHAGTISYTCGAGVSASMCNTLNTSIAGRYNSTFSNANAKIYIAFTPDAGLASTSQYQNFVPFSVYSTALALTASHNATDTAALQYLAGGEPGQFAGGEINLTGALEAALGLSGATGILEGAPAGNGGACTLGTGTANCFNASVALQATAPDGTFNGGQSYYYRDGSTQGSNAYDIYTVIEHETDEVLGSASCISTSVSLSDGCGGTNGSAADLFRFNADGSQSLINMTPGAYFSFNGGMTHVGQTYNTLPNGEDYADFSTNCTSTQDAEGCLGQSFDFNTDASGIPTILDTVGYNLNSPTGVSATPEPSSFALLGTGVASLAGMVRRRRNMTR